MILAFPANIISIASIYDLNCKHDTFKYIQLKMQSLKYVTVGILVEISSFTQLLWLVTSTRIAVLNIWVCLGFFFFFFFLRMYSFSSHKPSHQSLICLHVFYNTLSCETLSFTRSKSDSDTLTPFKFS